MEADGKIYCICCKKKTDAFDVSHNGAVIIVNAMRYPVCGKCLRTVSYTHLTLPTT